MPPVLKPVQAGDPEVRRPSGPDRLAVAIQNLAVPLTHSSRPRKRRDEIATSIHVSMSLALRRKGRPSAWCANPSDEIVRGPSDRVPGLSFSNRRPPQLAPAEMNRRMSGLVRSLSGFPPSGARITVVMRAGDGEAERRHGPSMGPRSENRGYGAMSTVVDNQKLNEPSMGPRSENRGYVSF